MCHYYDVESFDGDIEEICHLKPYKDGYGHCYFSGDEMHCDIYFF